MMVRRNLLLGFFAFSGLATGLAFLPRSVVSNKPAEVSSEAKPSQQTSPETKAADVHKSDPALETEIAKFRIELAESGQAVKKAEAGEKLAAVFMKAKQFDSAAVWYEKSMSLNPARDLRFEAGSAWFESLAFTSSASALESKAEKSRKLLSSASKDDPHYAEAQAKAAITWVNSPSPMKGILKLRELAEQFPENTYIAYQLGMLSFQSGQHEKAVDRFRKVLSLEAENVNAWFYLAGSLMQLGRKKEALEAAKSGYRLAKEDDSKASFEELLKQLEK
jgi:tetratricopeptide (TPR) repeat protein